jgi:hypothetical protein
MSVFAAALDAIFADRNMAADAVWREQGVGAPVACRVMRSAPDRISEFSGARLVSDTTVIDVRVSEIANPRLNDRVEIGAEAFVVQATPRRDRERLVWMVELRAA